ncbi:hypothetical protein GUJ93_ZPchr0012g20490 [Zizania palustris]|uniref:Uncharacterized protein n=1 Tax=Zizania palustris TaxID=103762 RepID=A0A8J5WNP6_ZIZPA|nr:hypothetical protein GUJ93_ZPchr0012g20490 [Zizania palustris]
MKPTASRFVRHEPGLHLRRTMMIGRLTLRCSVEKRGKTWPKQRPIRGIIPSSSAPATATATMDPATLVLRVPRI